jgi:hypothetical protein
MTKTSKPCKFAQYIAFDRRASKIAVERLTKVGLKPGEALRDMKKYLLEGSGATSLRKISRADFERLICAIESATPKTVAGIVSPYWVKMMDAFDQGVEEGFVRAAELSSDPENILRQFRPVNPQPVLQANVHPMKQQQLGRKCVKK